MRKKTVLITLLALTLVVTGCSLFQKKVTPYSFTSAIIELNKVGSIEGSTTIYLKEDKALYETHAVSKISGTEEKIDTLLIDLGEKMYQIDLNRKTGIKVEKNPTYQKLKELPESERMAFLNKAALGAGSTDGTIKPSEQRVIAGQTCDVYTFQDVREVCLWNGIALYERNNFPDANIDSTVTASKIEVNVDVPDSKFDIPTDITFSERAST